ncbi:MAG: acyltransferase [Thermoanaerobaculia bacterium]
MRLLVGGATFLLFACNTVFWCTILFFLTALKLLVPIASWRRLCSRGLVHIANCWIACNSMGLAVTQGTRWDVEGLEGLDPRASCVVLCNHQSWVDIPVLQRIFLDRIPFLRFFLKHQLIWVPLLGAAWWALDFPFMRRYPREVLEKHPEKRGEDLLATRRACERLRDAPFSILSFVEGTRFTKAKQQQTNSPFRYLLPPKVGGLAFAAAAAGASIQGIVDVTIVYPSGIPTFWDAISRGIPRIVVHVRKLPIPVEWFDGDYLGDLAFRERIQAHVRTLWEEKDGKIARIMEEHSRASRLAGEMR